jgi:hypothetical protein
MQIGVPVYMCMNFLSKVVKYFLLFSQIGLMYSKYVSSV